MKLLAAWFPAQPAHEDPHSFWNTSGKLRLALASKERLGPHVLGGRVYLDTLWVLAGPSVDHSVEKRFERASISRALGTEVRVNEITVELHRSKGARASAASAAFLATGRP